MTPQLRSLVPLARVADVERSIAFYTTLGFELGNLHTPDDRQRMTWAALELHEARLMLAEASDPVVPDQQAVLFYLYYDDIDAEHARLAAAGLAPGPMAHPFYCPKGEFRITDPDGYCLMLTHT